MATDPTLLIDVIGGTGLDVADELGRRDVWFQSEQNVGVIWTAINSDQLLSLAGDDAGHVFLQLLTAIRPDYARASGHGKDDVEIDLRISVGHSVRLHAAPDGAWLFLHRRFYRYGAPPALFVRHKRNVFEIHGIYGVAIPPHK